MSKIASQQAEPAQLGLLACSQLWARARVYIIHESVSGDLGKIIGRDIGSGVDRDVNRDI